MQTHLTWPWDSTVRSSLDDTVHQGALWNPLLWSLTVADSVKALLVLLFQFGVTITGGILKFTPCWGFLFFCFFFSC